MFGPKRHCVVVVGAQWGDEGKGKIVDVLAERADLVVRYQGGANAGHTVVVGDDELILHQIPSGILHPATRCIIGNGVVLDPETLADEIEGLEARGVEVAGRLAISDRAHLVLPYHKLLDRELERTQKIGTTGRGIGPAYEHKFGRRGLRVGDLQSPSRVQEVICQRVGEVNRTLEVFGATARADEGEHLELLSRLTPSLLAMMADTGLMTFQALQEGRRVLLEGAQGALLDVDHGTYPFVTSSNTTAGGAAVGAGIGPTAVDAVLGVVKAYTTRVGNGPLPSEAEGGESEQLREFGSEYGATTGRPRRCGWFDAVVLRYAVRINGLTDLAVTKLDVLDTLPRIPICVGYTAAGQSVEHMPSDVAGLNTVEPVYEVLDGWCRSTKDARVLGDLPREARVYLDRIQELVSVPIAYVSVGARRDQIIGAT
jgi:adenylosuccinate synthase